MTRDVSLDIITGQPRDYIVCCNCGCFKWYEDTDFCSCCNEKTKTKPVTKKRLKEEWKFWTEIEKDNDPIIELY